RASKHLRSHAERGNEETSEKDGSGDPSYENAQLQRPRTRSAVVVLRFRPVYNVGPWRRIQDGSHEPPFPPMMILRFGVRP
ncbi:MAG: hypothetical protein NTY19_17195, partial [Planctomycetota bacterium]|nr:hypothetical protein [Planctomycetota bacterium]